MTDKAFIVKAFKITQQQYLDLSHYDQRHLILPEDAQSVSQGDYLVLNAWDNTHQVYLNPGFNDTRDTFTAGSDRPQASSGLLFEVMFVEQLDNHQILSLRPETHTIKRSLIRGEFSRNLCAS
ncbi:hypothetical protein JK159_02420 [Weissella minor]|uniref:hypothetical protein n=1 Tax=Weissella minor TaxID=1620 RepID=UPI001BAF3BDB|nr:hypothetical protein [Weissella minor]MBS0949238.1 hypothetical protein [Weissella minor]